jgi:hypothetical protein
MQKIKIPAILATVQKITWGYYHPIAIAEKLHQPLKLPTHINTSAYVKNKHGVCENLSQHQNSVAQVLWKT